MKGRGSSLGVGSGLPEPSATVERAPLIVVQKWGERLAALARAVRACSGLERLPGRGGGLKRGRLHCARPFDRGGPSRCIRREQVGTRHDADASQIQAISVPAEAMAGSGEVAPSACPTVKDLILESQIWELLGGVVSANDELHERNLGSACHDIR